MCDLIDRKFFENAIVHKDLILKVFSKPNVSFVWRKHAQTHIRRALVSFIPAYAPEILDQPEAFVALFNETEIFKTHKNRAELVCAYLYEMARRLIFTSDSHPALLSKQVSDPMCDFLMKTFKDPTYGIYTLTDDQKAEIKNT